MGRTKGAMGPRGGGVRLSFRLLFSLANSGKAACDLFQLGKTVWRGLAVPTLGTLVQCSLECFQKQAGKEPQCNKCSFPSQKGLLLPCSRNSSRSVQSRRDYGRNCNEENRKPSGWRCQNGTEESPSCVLWGWLSIYRSR